MQHYELLLSKFIDHAAKWHPSREVVTGGGMVSNRVNYAELRTRALKFSAAFQSAGLRRGDRIATLAWNSEAHLEVWFGAFGIGLVCHTLNPRLPVEQLARMINEAADRLLLVSPDQLNVARELLDLNADLELVVVLDEPRADGSPTFAHPAARIHSQQEFLDTEASHPIWGGFDEDSDAGLCFTSGTTGAPKGVLYTHRSNYLQTLNILQADVMAITKRDSVLAAVPMFHANGWGLPFAVPAAGAKFVLPGRHLDGASLARLITAEEVTLACGVPTVWLGLADHLQQTGEALPSLQRLLLGGAPVSDALLRRLEQELGVTIQLSWGMTELSPLGTVMPPNTDSARASQSGRPPVGVDLRITDDNGAVLPEQRNHEGHLQAKGPSVINRYLGENSSAVDADGWFDTGDLAIIDEEGILSITGRAKDLIKSGGEWINPAEIEAIVGALPSVRLAAVVGRSHPKWGERPVLVLEENRRAQISDEDVMEALQGKIPGWWLPDAIIRLDSMPVASTGKIDKAALRGSLAVPNAVRAPR